MLPPVESQLPGMEETAALALRALLMPDGRISHYEVEGRDPQGKLIYFSARVDGENRIDPVPQTRVILEWQAAVARFSIANRATYTEAETQENP